MYIQVYMLALIVLLLHLTIAYYSFYREKPDVYNNTNIYYRLVQHNVMPKLAAMCELQ